MRALCLTACAALALGCSDKTDAADAGAEAAALARARLPESACALGDPAPVLPDGVGEADAPPWFVRVGATVRAYAHTVAGAELRWRDGAREGRVPAVARLEEGRFAFAGERILVASLDFTRAHLATLSPDHVDPQPVRASLGDHVCDVRVTGLPGRALVTWLRGDQGECVRGEVWAQMFGPRGEALGPARPLLAPEGPAQARHVEARWDFGRAVVTAEGGDALEWVLDGAGAVLSRARVALAGRVVCTRVGCMHVLAVGTGAQGGEEGVALRFAPLEPGRAPRAFEVNTPVTQVRALAASGDRVLALHAPRDNATGCDLTVVDVAARAVVAQAHDDGLRCDGDRVRATPRGFVLATVHPSLGPSWRPIDCSR